MPQTLAQLVRAKHPGAYDDMGDEQLEQAVSAKFPGVYDDIPKTAIPSGAATLGMKPQSTTTSLAEGYFEDLPGAQGQRFHPPAGSGDELHRPDNSVMGLPPELAVVSGLGVAAGAAKAGLQRASRMAGGAKAAFTQAAPAVKYELVKQGLEKAGVPSYVAMPVAMAASGYKKGSARTVRAKAPVAAPAAAVGAEAPVVAETAAVATPKPVAPPAASGMSPQRIQNELGLAARRSKTTLTEPQYQEAAELVVKGASPLDAVKAIASGAPVAAPKVRISGAEVKEYLRQRGMGKTDAQAKAAVDAARALAGKMGTPTSESVRTAVAARNATGRWQ